LKGIHLRLYLLVAGALTPMAILAILVALALIQNERETVERDAIGRAHAAMSAVDAHLRGSIGSLEILAASKNLEAGDIAAFHQESQRVLRVQPAWVNIGLASSDRVQLFNAVYALGKPEPLDVDDDSYNAVLRSAIPVIGDVKAGTAVRSPTVRVRVPVAYQGALRYVLSAPLNLKHFAALLDAQRLPKDWIITLVDRDKRVIVRIPAVAAGVQASDSFREAIEHSPEGWFQGHTAEGRPTYMSYVTSSLSGWVLGITVPAATVEAEAQRTFAMLGAGVLLAFAIGMLLAWLIAKPVSH